MDPNRNGSRTTWLTLQFLATGLLSLSIQQCPEVQVSARLSARDIRSTVGSNLATLQKESGVLDPWTSSPGQLKAALLRSEAVQVPLQDAWRVPYLSHLLGARLKCYYSGDLKDEKKLMSLIRLSKSELFCATKFFVGKFCASKRAQKTFKKLRK